MSIYAQLKRIRYFEQIILYIYKHIYDIRLFTCYYLLFLLPCYSSKDYMLTVLLALTDLIVVFIHIVCNAWLGFTLTYSMGSQQIFQVKCSEKLAVLGIKFTA